LSEKFFSKKHAFGDTARLVDLQRFVSDLWICQVSLHTTNRLPARFIRLVDRQKNTLMLARGQQETPRKS
jgi:hypothetical protein